MPAWGRRKVGAYQSRISQMRHSLSRDTAVDKRSLKLLRADISVLVKAAKEAEIAAKSTAVNVVPSVQQAAPAAVAVVSLPAAKQKRSAPHPATTIDTTKARKLLQAFDDGLLTAEEISAKLRGHFTS